MTCYVLLNESDAEELTPAVLLEMAADIQIAYDRDFAPACGVLPVDIVVAERGSDAPPNARIFYIVDDIPEAPGALAFHTVDDSGRPILKIGVSENRSEGGSLIDVLSESMSHEIFETERNPFVNRFVAGPWSKKLVADEACDPVQGTPYREGKTAISNFTLPAWSDAEDAKGPYDFGGKLAAPFACLPTGYLAFSDGTQHFGEAVSEKRRAHVGRFGRASLAAGALP